MEESVAEEMPDERGQENNDDVVEEEGQREADEGVGEGEHFLRIQNLEWRI